MAGKKNPKNINTNIPEGAWKRQPSNKVHRDKTVYTRKKKHKDK